MVRPSFARQLHLDINAAECRIVQRIRGKCLEREGDYMSAWSLHDSADVAQIVTSLVAAIGLLGLYLQVKASNQYRYTVLHGAFIEIFGVSGVYSASQRISSYQKSNVRKK